MTSERSYFEEQEDMDAARLRPEKAEFNGKKNLKKTVADLTVSQIEYLSVAFLEKDLTPEQIGELEQNIRLNRESRMIFDSLQKIKLDPPAIVYKNKKSLKKLSARQNVIRIATAGLSAAATIAILIMSYLFVAVRNNPAVPERIIPENEVTFLIAANNPIIYSGGPVVRSSESIEKPSLISSEQGKEESPVAIIPEQIKSSDSQKIITAAPPVVPDLRLQIPEMVLIASVADYPHLTFDDDRSRFRRFIASTFREKILREKTYSDEALRPYEIALAGVDGINKLFDWGMELKETRDEAGEVKSVYFSSALLSFNAPVRKTGE